MKHPLPIHESLRHLVSTHLVAAIIVLILTVTISIATESPIRSIIPYGVAVAFVTWRHGISAGLLFAGLATLAAFAAGAFPTRVELAGKETGEALFTYLKLSVIAVSMIISKRIQRIRQNP